jgi:hypothetical protein
MILTEASPVTTFLAALRLKCSDAPCGYQEYSFSTTCNESAAGMTMWYKDVGLNGSCL